MKNNNIDYFISLGFDFRSKKNFENLPAFQKFTLEQKRIHKDKIILSRVGEFYETVGIDALMLIAYARLNSMGHNGMRTARAGCPISNIQTTLNCLTREGFSIAVYEEYTTDKKGPKERYLSQVYIYIYIYIYIINYIYV